MRVHTKNWLCSYGRVLLLMAIATFPALSFAEPYLAVREGQKCSACHTNITGGGKRTAYGHLYPSTLIKSEAASSKANTFDPQLNANISVGGDFRTNYKYIDFPNATAEDEQRSNGFDISAGNVYIEAALNEDLSFYIDQKVAPEGGRTREAMIVWKGLPVNSYVKVGKMFLPYGFRLQDDSAYIRQATGFNMNNADIGIEYGLEPGPWSVNVGLTNGTQGSGENNAQKQVSLRAAYIQPLYRLGLSLESIRAPDHIKQTASNVFGAINMGKFTVLGEFDFITNEDGPNRSQQQITYLALNYAHTKAINIRANYEWINPDDDIDEDDRVRGSLVGEMFINPFTQVRTGIVIQDAIPQNAQLNQKQFFIELHLFY